MPRNNPLSASELAVLFGTPIHAQTHRPVTPPINTASVTSFEHPANNVDHHDGNGTYTFRQRETKLNLTLGWELEANHVPTRVPVGVDQTSDGSVDDDGAEFVVLPAITKSPRYVLGLLKELVHTPRLNTNESCGFHIHVSASNIASVARMRQWALATEHLALQIQDLAFKAVPLSRKSNTYCKPITPITSGTAFVGRKYDNPRRYHWLNTVEMFRPGGIRTIEVRLLGHTHRWKYLLAWTLFSMELATRGWEVAQKPFDSKPHVDALGKMLIKIAKEIKPMDKRSEPIPEWVHNGLKVFDMGVDTWDRPLARVATTELEVRGLPLPVYSDDQPELPSNNDDDDYCPCGCGEEGRCNSQRHDDGCCDNTECSYCHENEECGMGISCFYCREQRHSDGEDCGRVECRRCYSLRSGARSRMVIDPAPIDRIISSDPIHPDNATTGRLVATNYIDEANTVGNQVWIDEIVTPPIVQQMTPENIRHTVEILRNQLTRDLEYEVSQQARDALLYGTGVTRVPYVDMSREVEESASYQIMDPHEIALSANRERDLLGGR